MTISNTSFPSLIESLEQIIDAAQASGNFKPLWNRFVKTQFHVSIVRHANAPATGFDLWLSPHPKSADSTVHVSEQKEKLATPDKAETILLSGADIVRRVPLGANISLVLTESTLEVSAKRVEWLRKSLQASQEAALQKKMAAVRQDSVAQANIRKTSADIPSPEAVSSTNKAAWILQPVEHETDLHSPGNSASLNDSTTIKAIQQAATTVMLSAEDIAALKPRFVTFETIGVEMFVPESWQEVRRDKSLKFVDQVANVSVEVSSLKRDNMTLENWMSQRLSQFKQETSGCEQTGESYSVRGAGWRGKISASATEFRRRAQDEGEDNIYLVCCYRTDQRVLTICIRAKASVFETQRGIYRWMLEKVDINEPDVSGGYSNAPVLMQTGALSKQLGVYGGAELVPSLFSLSFTGRIGRLRYITYSAMAIPVLFVYMLLPMLFSFLSPSLSMALFMVIGCLILLRPTVLRLHDLDLSGKWLFLYFLLPGLAVGIDNAILPSILFLIACLGLFLFPGTVGRNGFGSSCPPNSLGVKAGAALVILITIISLIGERKIHTLKSLGAPQTVSTLSKSGLQFSPDDKSFIVNFPGSPVIKILPVGTDHSYPLDSARSYTLDGGKHQYLVQRMDFKIEPSDKSEELDNAVENMVRLKGAVLLDSRMVRMNGFAARALNMKASNGNYLDLRLMFRGKYLYLLAVESTQGNENAPDITAFLDSFDVN